jgi:N-acetylmuramoyl-L-alanine amidase
LVELGFLTNKKEGAFLNAKSGQSKMAKAIKEAIIEYKKELDQNIGEGVFVIDEELSIENNTIPSAKKDVIFKIQIAASSRKIETKSYNFKGLSNITRDAQSNLYKYYYGKTSDYNEAQRLKNTAKLKGYSSCFIVAYKNGKKISVQDALKRP